MSIIARQRDVKVVTVSSWSIWGEICLCVYFLNARFHVFNELSRLEFVVCVRCFWCSTWQKRSRRLHGCHFETSQTTGSFCYCNFCTDVDLSCSLTDVDNWTHAKLLFNQNNQVVLVPLPPQTIGPLFVSTAWSPRKFIWIMLTMERVQGQPSCRT